MTNTLTKTIINCETGEVEILPLTAEEIATREADVTAWAAQKAAEDAEKTAKAAAKQSAQDKLKTLGLSDSEIAAITGGI